MGSSSFPTSPVPALHHLTFSCHHRDPLLSDPQSRTVFEQTLERVRRWYGFFSTGYVVMPEHVHLLISEPESGRLSIALQMLKQITAQQLRLAEGAPFWQPAFATTQLDRSSAHLGPLRTALLASSIISARAPFSLSVRRFS